MRDRVKNKRPSWETISITNGFCLSIISIKFAYTYNNLCVCYLPVIVMLHVWRANTWTIMMMMKRTRAQDWSKTRRKGKSLLRWWVHVMFTHKKDRFKKWFYMTELQENARLTLPISRHNFNPLNATTTKVICLVLKGAGISYVLHKPLYTHLCYRHQFENATWTFLFYPNLFTCWKKVKKRMMDIKIKLMISMKM